MPIVKRLQCDTCGKISKSSNLYEEGWIELDGRVSVGMSEFDEERGAWKSQWINGSSNTHYFCTWKCFKDHNDNKSVDEEEGEGVSPIVCEQDDTDNGSGEPGEFLGETFIDGKPENNPPV